MDQKQIIVLLAVVVVIIAVAAILLLGMKPTPQETTTPPAASEQITPEITTPETSLAAQIALGSAAHCSGTMNGTTAEIWMEFPKWRMEGSFDGMEAIIVSEGSDVYMYMMGQWFIVDGEFTEIIPSMEPTEEDVQTMLDNPDLDCQALDDVADTQFELPAGANPISLEEFIGSASETVNQTV